MTNKKIKINGKTLTVTRLNLKGWTKLDGLRKQMDDAVSKSDFVEYFQRAVQFIETASSPILKWKELPWYEFLEVFMQVVTINKPTIDFPILHGEGDTKEKHPWEYDGRAWYFWLNLFAENYGWNEQQIGELDIDTAIGLYQEIQIGEQFSKEWEWGLSEMAYPYNQSTKKSIYKPLERPSWMKPMIPKHLPVVKIRRDMMPVGNIIDRTGNG